MKIYRVTVKTTFSRQPSGTSWQGEVIYCGASREDARIAYHRNEPMDFGSGYGNRARETMMEVIQDAETDDFCDDPVDAVRD